ncbi:hypothetical protein HKX48_009355, partial [Thoreauomyces humboldtii]
MAQVTRLKREFRITRLLHHPNIVRLYDVVETEHEIALAMEHVEGGELFDYIVSRKRLNDRVARRLFRQIISALEYCHRSSVVHRDLKPENLLLDGNKNIKIIDFGFVKLFDKSEQLQTFCGSPVYASPEMILGLPYQGPEVDIWGLGVILFIILNGHPPFMGTNTTELYKKIANGNYETRTQYMGEDSADLIQRMLTVDPKERATIAEIRNHRWVLADFSEPPECYVPKRSECLANPDPAILAKFPMYGMNLPREISSLTLAEDKPIWALYHLLSEHEAREALTIVVSEDACGVGLAVSAAATPLHATSEGSVYGSALHLRQSGQRNMRGLSLCQKPANGTRGTGYSRMPIGPSTPSPVATANPFDLPKALLRRRSSVGTNGEFLASHRQQAGSQLASPLRSGEATLGFVDASTLRPLSSSKVTTSVKATHCVSAGAASLVDPPSFPLPHNGRDKLPVDEDMSSGTQVEKQAEVLPGKVFALTSFPKRILRRMSGSKPAHAIPITAAADTTSTKTPADIISEIERVMDVLRI